MAFTLKPLPYRLDALEPVMSRRTLEAHYGKHHAGYVAKLNDLVADGPLARAELASLIRAASKPKQAAIYNNASQIFNHEFFWESLTPTPIEPPDSVDRAIRATFESMANFRERFLDAATAHFGSGWIWLVTIDGKLDIVATHDADSPLTSSADPLFVCDVWEHAYYLDYQHMRGEFVSAVLERSIDWSQVSRRLEESRAGALPRVQKRRA